LSSILKALRKVENVPAPEQGENELRDRISRPIASGSPGPFRDRRPLVVAAGVGALLLGALLSPWFFTREPSPPQGTNTAETAAEAPAPEATGPVGRVPGSLPSPPVPSARQANPLAATPDPLSVPEPTIRIDPPVRASRPPAPAGREKPLPRPDIQDLKLEGIVWSDAPESRFAMIDGRIVRKGESIEGFRVLRIEEDHVLLQSPDGSRKQRLTVR